MQHRPRKRFGQNFLHDPAVIAKIVRSIAPRPGEHLVEIGPGQGAITTELLRAAREMDAVELDRDLIEPLARLCAELGRLHVHSADALTLDFCSLAGDGRPLRVVGNLPYNISTPLLFHLLDQARCIEDMHFMLQREVVERMAAGPGGKTYGRLSVMLQALCEVEPLFDIGPGAFNPPPKVHSAFVRLRPLPEPRVPASEQATFALVVARAFSQRRKTLRNSLRELLSPEDLAEAGVDPALRPEALGIAQFARLARVACKLRPPP